ncbi:ArsR/SmtB family transcription factor [Pelotomaculum propionicicum]|uniref:Transcriptional repressor SdpR n=1 Tax=Pelotomaculum propionicicum TaxID=258475 RepID=A0A4Y7RP93_9FIRM|nr:metalloregulator ArsR/SmtB family transcription factor [Pelotomaculum propionicicum]NLI13757.1 winged helix-turn-helix transcriptional regulator [Peptococcaceae bacterium]TEB10492.1 Transcriptional repressor SdpR [Pelotomaculum propionicicum]
MVFENRQFREAVRVYKALGEPTRLKIVQLLLQHKELSCTDIIEHINVTACSTLSHHIKLLMDCGLLELRKEGTYHIYRLQVDLLKHYAPGVISD